MRTGRLKNLLAIIWVANVFVCLATGGWYLWYGVPAAEQMNKSAVPPTPYPSLTPKPSITPIPPPTQRATITLWPTPSRGPSVTPMTLRPPNVSVIGYSVRNRALEVHRFGAGPVNKLIVAGIHGGYESNTVDLADELIAYLNEHPERIPGHTTLYILRSLNPDGFAQSRRADGRANANNVDLNRNWPYNWVPDWPRDGCFRELILSGGTGPGSEPEVQALIGFIDRIKPLALISYHSAALGIFPGGLPAFPPSIRLAEAVAEVTDYPYPPIDTGCIYTGNLTDWAANVRGIPSIDIELTNHVNTDFDQNLRVLQVFLDWLK